MLDREFDRIFLDLDDVLVDFVGSAYKLLVGNYKDTSIDDYTVFLDFLNKNRSYREKAFERIARGGPSWWTNLPKLPWADELISVCKKSCNNVYILTDPGPIAEAATGKWQWAIDNGLERHILLVRNKSLLATPNSVLIDDRNRYIVPWIECGGMGIRMKRRWRKDFGYRPSEIIRMFSAYIELSA